MRSICDEARDAYAKGTPGERPDTEAHLLTCADCQRVTGAYARAVGVLRAEPSPPLPAFRAIRDAARTRRDQRRWWQGALGRPLVPALGWGALAALVAVVLLWPRAQEPRPEPSLVVARVGAPATVVREGERGTLGLDEALPAGAIIETGAGEVAVEDAARASLVLAPRSRVRVERWGPDAVVALHAGAVQAHVRKRAPWQSFQVRTEHAVVTVVGTRFTVERDGAGTRVVTHEGLVRVERPGGALVALLKAGETVRVGTEEPRVAETVGTATEPGLGSGEPAAAAASEADPSSESAATATSEGHSVGGAPSTASEPGPSPGDAPPTAASEPGPSPKDGSTADSEAGPSPANTSPTASEEGPSPGNSSTAASGEGPSPGDTPPKVASEAGPSLENGSAAASEAGPSPKQGSSAASEAGPSPKKGSKTASQAGPSLDNGSAAASEAGPTPENGSAAASEAGPRPSNAAPAASETPPAQLALAVRPQAPSAEHRAAEEPPSDAAALEEARALLAEGRDEQALALLLGATRRPGPHRGRLLSLLGDAHRVAGRFAEAAAAYEQALATPTPPPGVVAELAGLQETALGRADEARLTWARYLEQHPRGRYAAQAHMELARLSPAPGEAAEGHLRAALTLAPGTPEAGRAYVGLGRRLLDAKRWSEAEALFEPALDDRQAARAEAALVGLMRVRLAQGRPDEVRALAERHTERFESGARADEVARILRALD